MTNKIDSKISVIGTGYVGKPLIEELSNTFEVIAYDINKTKIETHRKNNTNKNIYYTYEEKDIRNADAIIVCVPTPVDDNNTPNLKYIDLACETIGKNIKKNTLIIFESSYMPTCTEEHCIPLLEKYSNMKYNKDFYVGYSPERINPGDKKNTLNSITKLISASNDNVLERMEKIYSSINGINLYKVKDIKIAELSKLVENCQRDINIAFVNELSKLCHSLSIDINNVLDAASTKWNFSRYNPGLVGGDCVGVNSYYLMNLANKYNVSLDVLKTARNVNLDIIKFIVDELDKMILNINQETDLNNIKITIYGYSYKENIPDVSNTRVIELYEELKKRNYNVNICDNIVEPSLCKHKINNKDINDNDVIILAVPHEKYSKWETKEILKKYKDNSKYKIFIDIKSKYKNLKNIKEINYWNL